MELLSQSLLNIKGKKILVIPQINFQRQLVESLSRKVNILDEEMTAIKAEMHSNERVGDTVMHAYKLAGAMPSQINRLNTHIMVGALI